METITERKVKCCYCLRIIRNVSRCTKTGLYFGRCACRNERLAVIHNDTYNDGGHEALFA